MMIIVYIPKNLWLSVFILPAPRRGLMLVNIIDERNRPYRWKSINAIIEDTWHDNSVGDADQITNITDLCSYEQREHISVQDAINWAQEHIGNVTLYLYDEDSGIYEMSNGGDDEYRTNATH